jgi:hypothetical protein
VQAIKDRIWRRYKIIYNYSCPQLYKSSVPKNLSQENSPFSANLKKLTSDIVCMLKEPGDFDYISEKCETSTQINGKLSKITQI